MLFCILCAYTYYVHVSELDILYRCIGLLFWLWHSLWYIRFILSGLHILVFILSLDSNIPVFIFSLVSIYLSLYCLWTQYSSLYILSGFHILVFMESIYRVAKYLDNHLSDSLVYWHCTILENIREQIKKLTCILAFSSGFTPPLTRALVVNISQLQKNTGIFNKNRGLKQKSCNFLWFELTSRPPSRELNWFTNVLTYWQFSH